MSDKIPALIRLTDLNGQCVLVHPNQIACAYRVEIFATDDQSHDFDLQSHFCTKLSIVTGDEIHVQETTLEIFDLTHPKNVS